MTRNNIILSGLILSVVIGLCIPVLANTISTPDIDTVICDFENNFEKYGVEYFAYMKLEDEEQSMGPIILEARKRIINRESWVADDVNGRIVDRNGNIVEILPHFSELFPSDWEPPTNPVLPVDKAYYGLSD